MRHVKPYKKSSKTSGNSRYKDNIAVYAGDKSERDDKGLYISNEYFRDEITGKPYPSAINFTTQRVLGYNSTIIRAIVTLRSHQVSKQKKKIVAKDENEPSRKLSVLNYSAYDLDFHPAFDDSDKDFLLKIYDRLDPRGYVTDKKSIYDENESDYTSGETATIDYLQKKHDKFYRQRLKDINRINNILDNPDPWFTKTTSWESLLKKVLNDLLVIDRGVMVKIYDTNGEIRGLMPLDGATIRPVINEFGTIDDEKAFVQVVGGHPKMYLKEKDTIIMMMNPVTDIKYFGYGVSPMETLYYSVLADLFIDKGNLDYYRKGGSIPEGFISIEPAGGSVDGVTKQIDASQLEAIQRQLQAIMFGDYTQVPIVTGGKVAWVDFKGKRRDMQYKELAEHLIRKICAVYQVSPQDVAITGDVNKSSAEVQADMTRSKGLETLMMVVSEYFTRQVVDVIRPQKDLKLWFENDDLEQEKLKWNMEQQQIVSGAIPINEWRASRGKSPKPWGDTPLQGLRNWKPEEEDGGALGGLPSFPGMDLMSNPSASSVGGDNPGAGQEGETPNDAAPIGSTVKSTNFFKMAERDIDSSVVGHYLNMYTADATFPDYVKLQDINNYPGSQYLRKAYDSYEHSVKMNAPEILINKSIEPDPEDIYIFSKYDGNGIVTIDENGKEPLLKSLARARFDTLPDSKKSRVVSLFEDTGDENELVIEAMEMVLFKSLDKNLQNSLYDDLYRFKTPNLSDGQIDEVGEVVGIK